MPRNVPGDPDQTDLTTIEEAVVAIRRSQKRRALARLARHRDGAAAAAGAGADGGADAGAGSGEDPLPDAVFELLDAVSAASGPAAGGAGGAGGTGADRAASEAGAGGARRTVTALAAALGVDQPRASRLAAQALEAGLLRREADQEDGRRSLLVLTARGRQALGEVSDFRRGVIAEATAEWPAADVRVFAELFDRFVTDFTAVVAARPER